MQQITIKSHDEECELLGLLVDCVEDFLTNRGITSNQLRNNEPNRRASGALIYGTDYDELTSSFAGALGIEKDASYTPQEIYDKINLQNRIEDVRRHSKTLGISLTETDMILLARKFINHYDCNVAENDQFEALICNYERFRKSNKEFYLDLE